jgi:uncharacterized GH25 family protein
MKRPIAWLMTLCFACAAHAHFPYLLPNKFDLDTRDHVSVQASLTEDYLVPDVVMKADDYHVVQPDGARVAATPTYTKDVAVLDVATTQNGTYRISTGNRAGRTGKAALMADGTWKPVREGHGESQGEGMSEGSPAGGKVHEVRSITRADVYVSRGSPTDTALALANSGLEFQFLTHPNRLLAGSQARLRLLYDGKPVAGQVVTMQSATFGQGASAAVEVRSGADGSVALSFPTAGVYHAMARHRFALPASEGKAESHTLAVTLEVGE